MITRSPGNSTRPHLLRTTALVVALATAGAACSSDKTPSTTIAAPLRVVVTHVAGSPLSELISEIYAQSLEAAGVRVGRKDAVADRDAYINAMGLGEVQVVPDATGELLTYLEKGVATDPAPRTVDDEIAAIKAKLPATLVLATPTLAENKPVVACRKAFVDDKVLGTYTDLGLASADITLATGLTPADGPLTPEVLEAQYHASFKAVTPLADAAAVADAVKNTTIDCLIASSTDPVIADNELTILSDDKAVVRPNALVLLLTTQGARPDVTSVIDSVSAQLTTQLVNQMLGEIAKGTTPDVMAQAFVSNIAKQ